MCIIIIVPYSLKLIFSQISWIREQTQNISHTIFFQLLISAAHEYNYFLTEISKTIITVYPKLMHSTFYRQIFIIVTAVLYSTE